MDKNKAISFANENPVCFVATIENNEPRVRALGFWFADETGFYFQTGSAKDLTKQIQENPNIEVLYYKAGEKAGETLRVSGKAEFLDNPEIKKRCIVDRPFLKQMGIDFDSPELVIFRISNGKLHFWNWKLNFAPKKYIEF